MILGNTKFIGESYTIKIWNGERLGKLIAFDTETTVQPFHRTPELVTTQVYGGGNEVYYVEKDKLKLLFNMHYDSIFIAHNAIFDMDVLQQHLGRTWFYDLYDRNKIRDTSVLYRLLHLAQIGFIPFKYNLNLLTQKFLGVELDKEGEERTTFEQYLNKKISSISPKHLEYGAKDVIATYQVYLALLIKINPIDKFGTLLSHDIQVKGEVALTHIRKHGIEFDLEARDKWLADVDTQMDMLRERLANWGWVRGVKGLKERYAQIMNTLGLVDKLPRSEKSGDISSKSEDLEPYKHISFIADYLKFQELEKASSFVRDIDASRIHPRYTSILNTGRTSCSKPNFQQLPRLGGIREMFKASSGNIFIITDYSTLELATLSQVLLKKYGYSVMGDKINEGVDLHKYYASVMNGCEMEDVTKQMRQEAKAANFGFPGGLGLDTFIQFSSGYGLNLTREQARVMKEAWFEAFPEMKDYLETEEGCVYTLTGRKRGNTTFCAEKNTPFQGLAADGAKLALYNLDKAGFKIVGFVHDEIICEVPEESDKSKLLEMEKIMIDSMRTVCPDIKISVESQLSYVYTK